MCRSLSIIFLHKDFDFQEYGKDIIVDDPPIISVKV